MTMQSRFHRLFAPAVMSLLAAAALHAADTIEMSAAQLRALGIETTPLSAGQGGGWQEFPAQAVIPNHQVYVVDAPLPGLVEHLAVAVNDAVRKGQLLARVQSPNLLDIERGFLQAATQLQLAKESLARDEKLLQEGIIAESRYHATRSRYAEISAAFAERRQALLLAGIPDSALSRLQSGAMPGGSMAITSPIDGVVLEQLVTPGQRLEGTTAVYKIARLDPLWLEIQVPVAALGALREGAAVTIPKYDASGKILSIGRSVSTNNQTILVRALISNGAARLRPGQFVETSVAAAPSTAKQWSVPNASLVRHEGRLLVFVQTKTGFRAQAVQLVREGAATSLIGGELQGGERIAVRGVASIKASLMGIKAGE